MDDAARRRELKAFLRARREALHPEDAGLVTSLRRRTPGLRREEVASIADVGITWYTWLEQGRPINVSRETIERIANALRLTRSDERYLLRLSGVAPTLESPTPEWSVTSRCALFVVMIGVPGKPTLELLDADQLRARRNRRGAPGDATGTQD